MVTLLFIVTLPVTASVLLRAVAPATVRVPLVATFPLPTPTVKFVPPTVRFPPVTSSPFVASTLPPKITCPLPVCVTVLPKVVAPVTPSVPPTVVLPATASVVPTDTLLVVVTVLNVTLLVGAMFCGVESVIEPAPFVTMTWLAVPVIVVATGAPAALPIRI